VITVARFMPLAERVDTAATWSNLGPGAVLTAALFCAAILALGPGLFAVLRLIDRMASSPRLISRLVAEEAPRPGDGPA
jgi:hypothetical protein